MNLTLPAGGTSPPSSLDMECPQNCIRQKLAGARGHRNRRRTPIRLAGMGIAAQLLEGTDMRLSEIASRVG